MFGMTELIVILTIVLLVFGARRLPQLGKAFGESLKEFKKASKNNERDVTPIEPEKTKHT